MNNGRVLSESTPPKRKPGVQMTVSELAKRANVTPDVVRHYVRIGLLQPERDEHNGYKLFSEQDIMRIRFIRRAKQLGYTLKEIKQIFQDSRAGRAPCAKVKEFLERHILENRQRLAELSALQKRMEMAIAQWRELPEELSNGDSICYLIETIADLDEKADDSSRC